MELDELKRLWHVSERKLEASMRLNLHLVQQSNLGKADTALKRLRIGLSIEVALSVVVLLLLGGFAADHVGQPGFFVPAALLEVYAIGLTVANARQIAAASSIDFDEPVVSIQRRLEQLRLLRIHTTKWTLLFAPLMWLPILIVALRGLLGVDLYAVTDTAWLIANVAFGLAVIPIVIWLARKYGSAHGASPLFVAFAREVAGDNLRAACDALDAIRRFEEE